MVSAALTLVLLTQCRPSPSATPVDPKNQTPQQPVEAKNKQTDPTLPPPPMNPPVEAAKKTPPKTPEFRFVSHPSLTLKKIGSLTQPVQSLALHPDCKAVAAGAKNWELARFGADGKLAWSTRKVQVACPAGNRCNEFPRAQFLPNDNIVAMMDGDSLRMFNPKGRMLALRGGFLQAVLDFRVSPDGKLVGALYHHGLALWRTTGGLLRKVEIPGATRFVFSRSNEISIVVGKDILVYPLDLSHGTSILQLDNALLELGEGADFQRSFLTSRRWYKWDKDFYYYPIAEGSVALRSVSTHLHRLLSVRDGRYVLQFPSHSLMVSMAGTIVHRTTDRTYDEWELAGVTPGADPVTAANDKCIAIASGNDVYFLALPDPLP
ncbi:hypothetical protein KJ612_15570 [Myxococcota bacterium]|nr:hypothetical protein [Myxococcota bacterium]